MRQSLLHNNIENWGGGTPGGCESAHPGSEVKFRKMRTVMNGMPIERLAVGTVSKNGPPTAPQWLPSGSPVAPTVAPTVAPYF